MSLYQTFKKNIIQNNLIKQGDRIVVGVSGGADSVCLLMCLYKYKKEMPFEFVVVHINHMLRGKAADSDEEFVKKLCSEIGVYCETEKIDIAAFASEKKLSIEEAGREARYSAFARYGDKIAVAHNEDDKVETTLLNIIRGSDLSGISSIKMKDDRKIDGLDCVIVRPLLNISKNEIEKYLKQEGYDYVTDETNQENDYTRNKIRNKLIPFIENEFNPKFKEHIINLSESASEANEIIDDAADAIIKISKKEASRIIIKIKHLKNIEDAVGKKIVYKCICEVAGSKKDITRVHTLAAFALVTNEVGSIINLPYGVIARRTYEEIIFEKQDEETSKKQDKKPIENDDDISRNEYEKVIDCDKIKSGLRWRHRESGDVISFIKTDVSETGEVVKTIHEKSLNRFFIDEKIPKEIRDKILILADGKEIVWIPGYRLNDRYRITSETKNTLEIRREI